MATVKATKEPRPKRPRVDKGIEFEQLLRPIFKIKVDAWCKDNKDLLEASEVPIDKENKGAVVDNLVADFSSAFETMSEAAVHSYLAGVVEDGDDDDDDAETGEGDAVDDAD